MKTVEVAFAIIIFNFCVGAVTHAGLTTATAPYESSYLNDFSADGNMPYNVSTVSEDEQYTTSMNVFSLITSVTVFDWLYLYIPDEYHTAASFYILFLDAIAIFFYGIAVLEFFIRRTDLLGSSERSV